MKMIRKDFVKLYEEIHEINEDEAVKDVEAFLNMMEEGFKKYSKITIRNLGVFQVRETKEKKICDPRGNNEVIISKPRKYIKFKVSKNLEKFLYDDVEQ